MSTNQTFKRTILAIAIGSALPVAYAVPADTTKTADTEQAQQLETINVQAKRRISKRQNEVTGLGKVVKSSEDIDKELILNIRDLTRYDPGISVVEQGRGATSGYAMRGVDKNRVSMLVDGLSQAQSYMTLESDANGGAINEIEYENVKSIELSKGSSSAEYGSGALGGAVGFRTKEADDVIKQGQNWGLDSKTAYSSKNRQFTQSLAAAGRIGGFDGLAILTHRKGSETRVHSAAEDVQHSFNPLEGFFDEYDIRPSKPANARSNSYYIIKDDCPTLSLDCRKAKADPNYRNHPSLRPNLSPEEQAQADKMPYPIRTANAKDYTGPDRISPNPMKYASRSFFWKGGYRFSPNHYVGSVLEHTKQRYDIRDMTERAYYTTEDVCPKGNCQDIGKNGPHNVTGLSVGNGGITSSSNPLDGLVFSKGNVLHGARYAKGKFFDERHSKNRFGVFYQYQNPEKNTWADKFSVSFDHQNLRLSSQIHRTYCSDYPDVSKCRAQLDKPFSGYSTETNNYQELLNLAQLNWEKTFRLGITTHKLHAATGFGTHRSTMKHGDIYSEYVSPPAYIATGTGNGTYNSPRIYERENKPSVLIQNHGCNNARGDILDCTPRIIKGKQYYFALRDHIALGKWADLGLGVRYDRHTFRSDDEWTQDGTYGNWSWNAGLSIKPSQYFTASYRISNGFRVPAFYELYGNRIGAADKANPYMQAEMLGRDKLKAEKAFNQEIGLALKGDFGVLETAFFQNEYKDLLTTADKIMPPGSRLRHVRGFYNTQNIKLNGINILGKIDWAGISSFFPEGLYSNLAYNRVKIKERSIRNGYTYIAEPTLEAVQPGRIVAGIGYDQPEGRWGFNLSGTYSKAKENSELTGNKYYGTNAVQIAGKRTRAWYIYDLTAYYNWKQKFTLRGGIYNLTNRKYSTWESVRQSSTNAVNPDRGTSSARYAAPGRNFTVSLEMKF